MQRNVIKLSFNTFNTTVIKLQSLKAGSLLPLSALAAEYRHPFACYLQVDRGLIGQVVQVDSLACFGNCHFNLGPLVPFIEGRYGDKIWPGLQCGTQRGLVVLAVDAVSSVLEVPGSHARVNVAGPHAGNEYQVIIFTEGFNRLPVPLSGPIGKSISREVGVHAIKTRGQDIPLVFLLHQQGDKDGIVRRMPDAVARRVLQEFGPLLRVQQIGVVHIEEWQQLAGVGPVLEERGVLAVSKDGERKTQVNQQRREQAL